MATDPKKIAESRADDRKSKGMDDRQVMALEQIADSLEAMRIDFTGFQIFLGKALTPSQH